MMYLLLQKDKAYREEASYLAAKLLKSTAAGAAIGSKAVPSILINL